ncbi:MAG TPA: hypothetical protein VIP46_12770 [Pyrinomonadaceae bacterium]
MRLITRLCGTTLCALLVAPPLLAQHGGASITATGRVSPVVAVSAAPPDRPDGAEVQVSASGAGAHTLVVSLSDAGATQVDLPVRLRSNVGYSLRASLLSPSELAVRLSVAQVRATGKFVHANALEDIRLDEALAGSRGAPTSLLTGLDQPLQIAILSGPPISKAGTFTSPDNAVEVVLSIEVRPRAGRKPWSAQLTISATPRW